ncbi:DUF2339 domain-containing protein [Mesobacterium sp. TK19101]|uniref:DUF2339 domain-containing protein n=1 Tax=Mesobacterium hydrothermale TaxID=3111907 RepID=A0ABU6HHQ2_9RHOB|nr:DUF2339 domain-containing protein [Mesobacterium sp. TK19101]MEC3861988.1 DUF2339 domain-containing protein [Mesobacterium sp. TK19101]
MDAILVVVAMAIVAVPVLLVGVLVAQARLRKRVDQAERQITALVYALENAGTGTEHPPTTAQPAKTFKAATELPKDSGPPDTLPARDVPAAAKGPQPWASRSPVTPRPVTPEPPKAIVARRDSGAWFGKWLRDNWFYAISAVSLALAGIFLVQYGMEQGYLPPLARVVAAALFGLILVSAGEVIRRRFGDGEEATTAYLPSVFSGAGIVSLFGAILAAHLLYALIGPEAALAGMALVALSALVLGWFHGPLLAAVGVVGAMAAPFLIGGASEAVHWLYLYFGIVALVGLGIDSVRRWAWVSVLTLVLAFAAGWLLYISHLDLQMAFALYAAALVVLSVLIPARSLLPDQQGGLVLWALLRGKPKDGWPIFPVRLSFASLLAATLILWIVASEGTTDVFWLVFTTLTALATAFALASVRAPALQDHILAPAGAMLVLASWGQTARKVFPVAPDPAEVPAPPMALEPSVILALATVVTVAAGWRSLAGGSLRLGWAIVAAVFAPAMAVALEMVWKPALQIGPYPWALHAAGLAALMTLFAERFSRVDGKDRLRASIAGLSVLGCLSFALVIVLSNVALTIAIAVVVLAAAALDRKFDLPLMTLAISIGVVAIGYRLVIDPGIDWALGAGWGNFSLAYGGALAALVAALAALPGDRPTARVMLDTGMWSAGGVGLSLALFRLIEERIGSSHTEDHWALGLYALIWLVLALVQVRRADLGGWLRKLRLGLAAVFGLLSALVMGLALTLANPLFNTGTVYGWPVLNTLSVAYLLPALALLAGAAWVRRMPLLSRSFFGLGLALGGFWLAVTIRNFWQGNMAMALWKDVGQPELYTYTVALLILGAGLFYQSLARGSDHLRRAGLVIIGLAVGKVFFVDISGLTGLMRVFSLLILGLGLAGLAWLNRWARARHAPPETAE